MVRRQDQAGTKLQFVSLCGAVHRALHDQIPLIVGTKAEHVVTDHFEAPSFIEGNRLLVPLPHAEPQGFVPAAPSGVEAGLHESGTDSAADGASVHVNPMELEGACSPHARVGRPGSQLGVSDRRICFGEKRKQEQVVGISEFGAEPLCGERLSDVGLNVVVCVLAAERILERPCRERGQLSDIAGAGRSNMRLFDHVLKE